MPRRVVALAALIIAIGAAHMWLALRMVERMRELSESTQMPKRLRANYVSEVHLSAPPKPVAAAAPPPPAAAKAKRKHKPRAAKAVPAASAASQPQEEQTPDTAASAPVGPTPPEPSAAPAPVAAASSPPSAPEAAAAPPAAAASAAAAASGPAGFAWPTATRIRYELTGQYRGEIKGSSEVEWVCEGSHYQVRVSTRVGLGLFSRTVASDGVVTEAGLSPKRFDENAKGMFITVRRATVLFGDDEVVMGDGQREPKRPNIQDEASQFVQLTYDFIQHPERAQTGTLIQMPMVLKGKQRHYVYEVVGTEPLDTPVGKMDAVHLKPREPAPGSGQFVLELWFAPQLEYLPVRIKIWQNEETYIDLLITHAPQRGAPAAPGSACGPAR